MALSPIRDHILTLMLAAAVVTFLAGTGHGAEESGSKTKESAMDATTRALIKPLPASKFFTLAPFIVPVISKGKHERQLVLVVAIALEDQDDRVELRRLSAKLRNEIYELLFKMVTFRTIEPRIPRKKVLESRLTKAAQRVAGVEIVKSIVVHASQLTRLN